MVNRKEVEEVKWTPTAHQLADCLTKQGAKIDNLLAVIRQQMRLDPTHLRFMPIWHE